MDEQFTFLPTLSHQCMFHTSVLFHILPDVSLAVYDWVCVDGAINPTKTKPNLDIYRQLHLVLSLYDKE